MQRSKLVKVCLYEAKNGLTKDRVIQERYEFMTLFFGMFSRDSYIKNYFGYLEEHTWREKKRTYYYIVTISQSFSGNNIIYSCKNTVSLCLRGSYIRRRLGFDDGVTHLWINVFLYNFILNMCI